MAPKDCEIESAWSNFNSAITCRFEELVNSIQLKLLCYICFNSDGDGRIEYIGTKWSVAETEGQNFVSSVRMDGTSHLSYKYDVY